LLSPDEEFLPLPSPKEAHLPAAISPSHLDLLAAPPVAVLTTLLPDGRPHTTVVWCDYAAPHVRVNTMRGFRKERNMRADPRVTLLAYDPCQPLRSLEIRGRVVAMSEDGALAHLDHLARLCTGRSPYFGACVPAEFAARETPVLCLILPLHVVALDARPQ
jgi:PPOX class probable F420-dependent enzyme